MTISTISVSDMHCAACSSKIRKALSTLTGIRITHINPARRMVLVDHDQALSSLELLRRIEDAGFKPTLAGHDDHNDSQRVLLKRLGIAGLAMMQVMMAALALYAGGFDGIEPAYARLLEFTSLVFCIPVVCYSAMPFFTSALTVLTSPRRGISMDVPIALAIGIAFATSLTATLKGTGEVYYDSVVMFTFLLLGARYIDNRLRRSFDLTGNLLSAVPASAIRLQDHVRETINVTLLQTGDRVWVGEGAQVPVDGILQAQHATLDEAVLTGESDWVTRRHGERLYAGTLNQGPGFEIIASAPFDRSRIADIAALADQAEIHNAPRVQLADRIAGVFVPSILILAAVTYIAWQFVDPQRALLACLTVLVVSCPCALSLATPAALTAAMSRLRQLGIVLTSSTTLEAVRHIDRVFFDKTGTLTIHEPQIVSVEVLDGALDESTCLSLAGALQRYSDHPYARAFDRSSPMEILDPEIATGQGVRGVWGTRSVRLGSAAFAGSREGQVQLADSRDVFLNVDEVPCARFVLSDQVRDDAQSALAALKRLGIDPLMLSGDAEERCAETAQVLDIDFLARMTPESKLARLEEEKAAGHRVLMVGDGINDVPVLARADVSAAVIEASDLVKSRADVLLLSRRLHPLVDLFSVARTTDRITRQNLLWALVYNLTAIPIAALGFMPPWMAALGMASSSTLVMLNATRLLHLPSFDGR